MFLKDDLDYPSSPIFLPPPQQKLEGHPQDTEQKRPNIRRGRGGAKAEKARDTQINSSESQAAEAGSS